MTYLFGALVVVAVLAFVVWPLLRRRRAAPIAADGTGRAEERAVVYQELLELELDQKVGKISESEYQEQADALLARAAALISEDDARAAADDDALEREIAATRAALQAAQAPPAGETVR